MGFLSKTKRTKCPEATWMKFEIVFIYEPLIKTMLQNVLQYLYPIFHFVWRISYTPCCLCYIKNINYVLFSKMITEMSRISAAWYGPLSFLLYFQEFLENKSVSFFEFAKKWSSNICLSRVLTDTDLTSTKIYCKILLLWNLNTVDVPFKSVKNTPNRLICWYISRHVDTLAAFWKTNTS